MIIGRKHEGNRNWTGNWDPTQASNLINEFIQTGMIKSIFALELGNEIYGSVAMIFA